MIYCNLKGGLGNMLFQIATTKSNSIKLGVECSFPNLEQQLNLINDDYTHNPSIKHGLEYNEIFNRLNKSSAINSRTIHFPFEYIDINILDNDTIDGFFQSEKYFNTHRSEVLDLFRIPKTISNTIEDKYSDIFNGDTTSVHIRRGDYIKFPNHHPVLDINYYDKAIEKIGGDNKLIIFSDDIPWCKENLKYDNVVYIENEKDYIELYLMSLCTNNIIANSSFSWWGAWLNRNENKIVIGPSQWFGSAINHDTRDIIPESWIKI